MGLDTVELIHNIETHFAIRIPNPEAAKSTTVQEVYDDMMQLIAQQTGYEIQEIQPHHSLTNDLGMD